MFWGNSMAHLQLINFNLARALEPLLCPHFYVYSQLKNDFYYQNIKYVTNDTLNEHNSLPKKTLCILGNAHVDDVISRLTNKWNNNLNIYGRLNIDYCTNDDVIFSELPTNFDENGYDIDREHRNALSNAIDNVSDEQKKFIQLMGLSLDKLMISLLDKEQM